MKWGLLLLSLSSFVFAADAQFSGKRDLNISAIVMFLLFVVATLGITYWAAKRTKTAKDFYTAGGGITGFQNGLAIAGDYMSAASFLGISGLVYLKGFDGLIYSIGFLVGWPIILFLVAEQLRNLGKIHLLGRSIVPFTPNADPYPCGIWFLGNGGTVFDRADGRCRAVDPDLVRTRL